MGLRRETGRWLRRALLSMLLLLVLLVGGRAVQAWLAPDLPPWLTVVPQEPDIAALDAGDWAGTVAAEQYAFQAARREVASRLTPAQRTLANRFFDGSPLDPARFATDWNRSFLLTPDGPPAGAAVLLHGMTNSPFSMRHLAETYRARGWVAIVPRMPGHGILPAGLSDAGWHDWLASTRMAVREARARAGNGPIHLVGYSNGGALALKYALDAIEEPLLPRPDRLVLVSPMIGVTAFARFAGFAGLPALLPAFERAAWLDVVPEFNPFKFNSFPVNAARQSHLLTAAVQEQTRRLSAAGRLDRLAPVLTFQSVVDFHRQRRRGGDRALCPPSGEWQRARAVRPEPQRQAWPSGRATCRARAGTARPTGASPLSCHAGDQCGRQQRRRSRTQHAGRCHDSGTDGARRRLAA